MNHKLLNTAHVITVDDVKVKLIVDYETKSYDIYNQFGNTEFVFVKQGRQTHKYTKSIVKAIEQASKLGHKLIRKYNVNK